MEVIKLVIGITPTCWRVRLLILSFIPLLTLPQPPFGDVDDRVRAIAHALGLRTIIWKYDSNDWRAGTGNITDADVDANYEALIARAQNGTFSTVCSHLSPLGTAFLIRFLGWDHHAHPRAQQLYHVRGRQVLRPAQGRLQVPRPHGCRRKYIPALRRDQLFTPRF